MKYQLELLKRVANKLLTTLLLPRWLRRVLAVGLAIKVLPVPDLGIDELALAVVFLTVAIGYPGVWSKLVDQARSEIAAEAEWLDTSPEAGCC